MNKKFVEGDYKIKKHNQNTEGKNALKISEKAKKKLKSIVEGFKYNKLLARCPTILMGGMFIACFLYPGIDTKEVIKNWFIFLIGPFLTIFGLCIVLHKENKYKRLYKQACDGTIIIKKVEILKFKRYGTLRKKYESSNHGYRVIATDGEREYKSRKYSDQYLGLNSTNIHTANDYLKINEKTYHIGDKISVYTDFEKKNNYYLDV